MKGRRSGTAHWTEKKTSSNTTTTAPMNRMNMIMTDDATFYSIQEGDKKGEEGTTQDPLLEAGKVGGEPGPKPKGSKFWGDFSSPRPPPLQIEETAQKMMTFRLSKALSLAGGSLKALISERL
ncbi:unnamed protein product [Caenorhabditis auriculariae]|uniref:Uncharacterized protein n=1 Tax=Caenorhabditis auriculariae TaxID=2777116 RepID=A0A8S1HGX7_9PELO|nr:unnamed protein product [Caenorhabditis auriculariae]